MSAMPRSPVRSRRSSFEEQDAPGQNRTSGTLEHGGPQVYNDCVREVERGDSSEAGFSNMEDGDSASQTSQGGIASVIHSLPLDVGTVVSPTLTISALDKLGSSVCRGGPGHPTCGLEVKDHQQGVQCDLCLLWYHAQCQDISKAAYNALKRHKSDGT